MASQEERNFLTVVNNGALTASTKHQQNLSSVYQEFGQNFNTLVVLNTSGSKVAIYVNDEKIGIANSNGGTFAFDHRDRIVWDNLALEELDGAGVNADTIFMTVGRTG